jgi:hypothetical protein
MKNNFIQNVYINNKSRIQKLKKILGRKSVSRIEVFESHIKNASHFINKASRFPVKKVLMFLIFRE